MLFWSRPNRKPLRTAPALRPCAFARRTPETRSFPEPEKVRVWKEMTNNLSALCFRFFMVYVLSFRLEVWIDLRLSVARLPDIGAPWRRSRFALGPHYTVNCIGVLVATRLFRRPERPQPACYFPPYTSSVRRVFLALAGRGRDGLQDFLNGVPGLPVGL